MPVTSISNTEPPALPGSGKAGLPLARLLSSAGEAVAAVRGGRSLTEALARVPAPVRAGAQALSFLVLRHLGAAEHVRGQMVKKAPPAAQDALMLSALALLWAEEGESGHEAHTVVNQAVQAARAQSKGGAPFPGFLNAVLRRFLREQGRWREAVAALPETHPARTQHPRWWAEQMRADWPGHWQGLLAAANERAPMTLRVNTRRGDRQAAVQAYLQRLHEAGLPAVQVGPEALMLESPCPVSRLPGFEAGDVSVQDAAAQRAAPLLLDEGPALALRPGARVLDACAAPGGKTMHLLELADVEVWAIDQDAQRLQRVQDNLRRLGPWGERAVLRAADAARHETWWDGRPFDAILLDAPCSASGIVRRHPDVRWLRREADIAALAATQARLLDALWPLLAPGGRLLYCTCSVFQAEGEAQIAAFLQRQGPTGGAIRHPAPGHLLPLPDNPASSDGATAPPTEDGFYYALLQKESASEPLADLP
jgi:16S rRNA (cytosine967-C5)-methyltransferase